ncbi:MAG: DHH family phosphoesterase, partial [Lachnospiraceae bacterium]|nr:DHH family phosphoesterase [Lachnospiraceae bacterium]
MGEKKGTAAAETQRKRTACVVGHKNPDTDSICAAISYAYLKNQLGQPYNYLPMRAGAVSAETQYVLDRFHTQAPDYLENIGTRVKDMEIRKVEGVRSNISLKRAWTLMQEQNIFTLPITNARNKLKGLITINDIAKSYMEEYESSIVSTAKPPYQNILTPLEAEMIDVHPHRDF